jgi:hypothetical protein
MGDEGPPQRELVPRIGTFLILLGIFSLIFFITSGLAQQPDFDWLFVSLLLLGIGVFLRRRAAPAPSAGRFSIVRKLTERTKKNKGKKG